MHVKAYAVLIIKTHTVAEKVFSTNFRCCATWHFFCSPVVHSSVTALGLPFDPFGPFIV